MQQDCNTVKITFEKRHGLRNYFVAVIIWEYKLNKIDTFFPLGIECMSVCFKKYHISANNLITTSLSLSPVLERSVCTPPQKSKLIEIIPVGIAEFLTRTLEMYMVYSFVGLHVHLRRHGITWKHTGVRSIKCNDLI